jgi:hypothetical protein
VRLRYALGPVLVLLLILGTTTATTTATQATTPAAAPPLTPVALSIVSGAAEDALRGPITGPGSASTAPVVLLEDPGVPPPVPTATHRSQPNPARGVVTKAIPKPKPKPQPRVQAKASSHHRVSTRRHVTRVRSTGHALRGLASWYCNNNGSRGPISACHYQYPDTGAFNAYAAAGPKLRAALGNWRGRIVTVNGLRVKLVDWCQCYQGRSYEKLIDLYRDVYDVVGGSVTIRW